MTQPQTPKNPKLRAIAFQLDVPQLIAESEKEILDAWEQSEEEAELNEADCTFKIGFSVALGEKMETKMTFGVRHTKTIERAMPDPNQPELSISAKGK